MNTATETLFVIVGTAAITAFVIAVLVGRPHSQTPPTVYVQLLPARPKRRMSCLPFVVVFLCLLVVFWFNS